MLIEIQNVHSDFIKIREWNSWSSCAPFIMGPSHSLNSLHQETSWSANVVDQATRLSQLPTPPHDDQSPSSPDDDGPHIFYPDWNAAMNLPNLTTVETDYNPKLKKNTQIIFKRKNQENRWTVTERERGYAKNCKYPKNVHDFNKRACFLFSQR